MPWWLPLYFILLSLVTAFWLRDEIKDKNEREYVAAEFAAIVLLCVCGLAYWFPAVKLALGSASGWVFSASIGCLLLTTARDFFDSPPNQDLSPLARSAALIIGSAIYVLIYGPIIYWGFLSAFG